MDCHLRSVLPLLVQWAESKPTLRRLWVYGSRLKATHRADSDLDLSYEIDTLESPQAKANWLEVVEPQWSAELSAKAELHVSLQPYVIVSDYVNEHGQLLYERAS